MDVSVLLVTDSKRLVPGASVAARIEALVDQSRRAFAAGVDAVQIRESDLDGAILFDLARRLAALGPVIVTDRADVAIAARAAGVHLKSDGPDPARVRALLPAGMSLSRAVHTLDETRRFGSDAALDWLLAGTAFATASKPGMTPLGLEGISAIARASGLPVIAIGGITGANAAAVRAAGASGVAGIGIFTGQISAEYVDRLRKRSLE
jgi:thiamine-phosphate pyrophosphorylase